MSETWEPWRQDELNRAQEDALLAPLKEQIEELEADNARLKILDNENQLELNRQTGIIVRQRKTIADLDARVTFLQDKVADLHYQLTEAKDEVTYLKNLHEGEDKSW